MNPNLMLKDLAAIIERPNPEERLEISLWDWFPPTADVLSSLTRESLLKFDNVFMVLSHPDTPPHQRNIIQLSLQGLRGSKKAVIVQRIMKDINVCLDRLQRGGISCDLTVPTPEQEAVYWDHYDHKIGPHGVALRAGMAEMLEGGFQFYVQRLVEGRDYESQWVTVDRAGQCGATLLFGTPLVQRWTWLIGGRTLVQPTYHLRFYLAQDRYLITLLPIIDAPDDAQYERYKVELHYPVLNPLSTRIKFTSHNLTPSEAPTFVRAIQTLMSVNNHMDIFLNDPVRFMKAYFVEPTSSGKSELR